MNDREIKKRYIAEEFSEAFEFNDETRSHLNEKEQFVADQLVEKGYEVRFNEVHILHRQNGSEVISILRSNLPS